MMNSNSQEELSRVIELMRFPLIYLVVIAHMLPFITPMVSLDWTVGDNFYVFLSEMISHNLARISVRCYFIISGYYFFIKIFQMDWKVYNFNVKKRVRTLLIPYLFWITAIILATIIKHHIFLRMGLSAEEGYDFILQSSIYDLYWGLPINFPLWYMRDLMVMIILSPLFYYWFKYFRIGGLIPILIFFFSAFEFGVPGISSHAITFFALGAMFAILKIDFLAFCKSIKWISICLGVLLLFVSTIFNGTIYHEYYIRIFIFVGVFGVFGLFSMLSQNSWLSKKLIHLAPFTFFIYVAHEIYIINWLKGGWIRLQINESVEGKIIGFFLVPVLCIVVCMLLFSFWKRIHPVSLMWVTGGRIKSYINKESENE